MQTSRITFGEFIRKNPVVDLLTEKNIASALLAVEFLVFDSMLSVLKHEKITPY